MKEYIKYLKNLGLSSQETQLAIDIKVNGITMTKAIYKFNSLYNNGKIDGFPDSSIEVLEKIYGKNLKKMKFETLYNKILALQSTIISNPDKEAIKEAIEYYFD